MGKNHPSNPFCPAIKHPSPHNSGKTQGWLCLPRTRPNRDYPNFQYLSCKWVAELSVPLEQPGQNFTKLQSSFSPPLNPQPSWVTELWATHEPGNQLSALTNYPTTPSVIPLLKLCLFFPIKESLTWDFPSSPVVKTPGFQCRGHKFNPCLGNENPTCCIVQPKRKKKPDPKMGDFSLQQVSPYNISTLAKRWPLLERERWEEKQVCSRWGSAGKNICILYNMWKLICIYHIYFTYTYAYCILQI